MHIRFTRRLLPLFALLSVCRTAAAEDAAATGQRIYETTCAMCHGAQLKATGGIPDLRKTTLDRQAFLHTVREGRPGTIMLPMKERLSDADILNIRAYIDGARGE